MFTIYFNFTAFYGFTVKSIISYSNADRQKSKVAYRNTRSFGSVKQTVDNQPVGLLSNNEQVSGVTFQVSGNRGQNTEDRRQKTELVRPQLRPRPRQRTE